jgi:hypothetical protein
VAENDEYRELIAAAERALYDLLEASTPESWLALRPGYGELKREVLRQAGATYSATRAGHIERQRRGRDEIHDRWSALGGDAREELLFQVLGDDRLLIREIVERLNDVLVPEDVTWRAVYENAVRGLTVRLVRDGRLERIAEPWRGRVRYRYFRRRGLSGPIADLERAFHDEPDESL